MITKDQVYAVVERLIKTFFQALGAFVIAAGATGLTDVDWPQALNVAGLAACLSLVTSIVSWKVGAPGPSAGPEAPRDELLVEKEW